MRTATYDGNMRAAGSCSRIHRIAVCDLASCKFADTQSTGLRQTLETVFRKAWVKRCGILPGKHMYAQVYADVEWVR